MKKLSSLLVAALFLAPAFLFAEDMNSPITSGMDSNTPAQSAPGSTSTGQKTVATKKHKKHKKKHHAKKAASSSDMPSSTGSEIR